MGDEIAPYAITDTLIVPSVFFGVVSVISISGTLLISKYIKVRV
jgi:hypothetical protein